MLSYKDILDTVTKKISDNFDIEVIVDNQEGLFDTECFYVTIVPILNTIETKSSNLKKLIVSIKYFNESEKKEIFYDKANSLESLFLNELKVNDKDLIVTSKEANIIADEVGDMLDFLIYVDFYE